MHRQCSGHMPQRMSNDYVWLNHSRLGIDQILASSVRYPVAPSGPSKLASTPSFEAEGTLVLRIPLSRRITGTGEDGKL